jgi:hypothetical protein
MENFYNETIAKMEKNGWTVDDIISVTVKKTEHDEKTGKFIEHYEYIPIDKFIAQAKSICYDSGFGIEAIDTSLRIDFKDGFMFRMNYDGAEWWHPIKFENRMAVKECKDEYPLLTNVEFLLEHDDVQIVEDYDLAKEIFERFKAGGRLSTEELQVVKKAGYL